MGELFKSGTVDKVYWAVVEGVPEAEEGEIDLPLAPRSRERGWWMKVDPKGQKALTRWRVLGRCRPSPERGRQGVGSAPPSADGNGSKAPAADPSWSTLPRPLPLQARDESLALLELRPPGRTHQLRLHCAAMGWPILGDSIYGTAPRSGGPGLHLHARAVTVPLYPKKPPIIVEAPLPAHMRERVEESRNA